MPQSFVGHDQGQSIKTGGPSPIGVTWCHWSRDHMTRTGWFPISIDGLLLVLLTINMINGKWHIVHLLSLGALTRTATRRGLRLPLRQLGFLVIITFYW